MKKKLVDFQGKTIILFVPNHFELPFVFKKNLEFLGFKVFLLPISEQKEISITNKTIHFIKKNILGDRSYKSQIFAAQSIQMQNDFLKKIEQKIDYALIIRPDLISSEILEIIKRKVTFSVAYQWDGMQRFARTKEVIKYFHRFFVFDNNDTKIYPDTIHTLNFYFDYLTENFEISQDVFFIGTFMKDRIDQIASLSEKIHKIKLKSNINVIYKKQKHIGQYRNYDINFIKNGINFEEGMRNVKSSKIVLDFQNSIHNGLSLRTFEAVGFGKKLITNNPLVKKCNFFHPNNIFVITNNDLSGVEDFINCDFFPIPKNIVEQYSFTNWITKALKND